MTTRTFDAWAMPDWATPPPGFTDARTADDTAVVVRRPLIDPDGMRRLMAGLEARAWSGLEEDQGLLHPDKADERAGALGAVGSRFLDPEDSLRKKALALLPAASGLSPAMARAVLDGMAGTGPRPAFVACCGRSWEDRSRWPDSSGVRGG